jgi:Ca2+-binding EF-hand superfamily protein
MLAGTIDQQEMIAGLAKKGLVLSAASADDLMRSVDADGSGQIDFEEFLEVVSTLLR